MSLPEIALQRKRERRFARSSYDQILNERFVNIFLFSRIAALAVAAFGVWIIYINLDEAYGSGPPHYSMTTNMDKWNSPWPLVIGVVIGCFAVCWILIRWIKRP